MFALQRLQAIYREKTVRQNSCRIRVSNRIIALHTSATGYVVTVFKLTVGQQLHCVSMVGFTTGSAARLRSVLRHIAAKIVQHAA